MRNKLWLIPAILVPVLCLCICGALVAVPLYSRISWRVDELLLRIRYTLNPPTDVIFVPQQGGSDPPAPGAAKTTGTGVVTRSDLAPALTTATPTASAGTPAATASPPTAFPTLANAGTPTATLPPLPGKANLTGVVYESQAGRYNYCAPANLAMALSYWGWKGNKDTVGPALKPDDKDKNVMPYEIADYVNTQTNFKALERVGGDLDTLRRFVSAGYPVLVEKGTYLHDLTGVVSWMGHYQVVTGYDDATKQFMTQDSFIKADHPVAYEDMITGWRAFDYTYLLIFPAHREADVLALLGSDADETSNYQNAATQASNEIYGLEGIDQYFAWFNRGTNLVKLQDYGGASAAYDEAFKLYPQIPEAKRPWRMLWYQTGPYFAYYGMQRYYDLLYLADATLNAMPSEKNLEESYYWRGMARAALGEQAAAIEDFRQALQYHSGFPPAEYQLRLLGETP
jgi:tetratricopeptide (TPR) repeat protein